MFHRNESCHIGMSSYVTPYKPDVSSCHTWTSHVNPQLTLIFIRICRSSSLHHTSQIWGRLTCITYELSKETYICCVRALKTSIFSSPLRHTSQTWGTGWCRDVGCLIFIGHFSQKSPKISGSFGQRDLQLKAFYASSPPYRPALITYELSKETYIYHVRAQQRNLLTNGHEILTSITQDSQKRPPFLTKELSKETCIQC